MNLGIRFLESGRKHQFQQFFDNQWLEIATQNKIVSDDSPNKCTRLVSW